MTIAHGPVNGTGSGFAVAVLDALPDATAILNPAGIIVAVNRAWRMFAVDNGGTSAATGVGVDYLDVCARAAADGCADATAVLAGLRAVLAGETVESDWEYACPSPAAGRWYTSRATPIASPAGGAVVAHVNITRRKMSEQQLAHQASHDPLTGLANRALFTKKLTDALQPGSGQPSPADVGVLYIDLDDFKPINDSFDHDAGDEVLLTVTHRLRAATRPTDTVARLGGDEFAVIAPLSTSPQLTALVDRLQSRLDEPHQLHGRRVRVGANIGSYLARRDDPPPEALRAADQAMYAIKRTRSGRQPRC